MYMNRKSMTQKKLAEVFLSCETGDRIPTFSALHDLLQVGTGTIQSAIRDFQEQGAIELQAVQRAGTLLISKDIERLWSYLPNRHIVGLLPEPSTLEMRGLAMGLRAAFDSYGVPLVIVYGYGSEVRFDRVLSEEAGADLVISSRAAARHRQRSDGALSIQLDFGRNSFYQAESLVLVRRKSDALAGAGVESVGIDYSSYDHSEMTRAAFPEARYVEVDYTEIPFELLAGTIDAAVWHRTVRLDLLESGPFSIEPFRLPSECPDLEDAENAVVSVKASNGVVRGLLKGLEVRKVVDTQQAVLRGKLSAVF